MDDNQFRQRNAERRGIFADFLGTVCCGCGGGKRTRQSFCLRCYRKLNGAIAADLYRPWGRGYEEAFEAARGALTEKRR